MAREAVLRVRMTTEELAAAEARSSELGFENVSQFVRAMIRVAPIVGVSDSRLAAAIKPMRETVSTVETLPTCSKASLHVSGKQCGYCKQVSA